MRAWATFWRARPASIIESSFDAMSGLYTRQAFEQRVRAVRDRAQPHRCLERAVHRFGPAARHQRQLRHARGRQHHQPARRADPPPAAAQRLRGAHLRRSLRHPAAGRRSRMRRSSPNRCARAPSSWARCAAMRACRSRSASASRPSSAARANSCTAFAAAETACKAANDRGRNRVEVYEPNDASIVRRFTDINIASRLREAIEADRLRFDAQLIVPFGSAEHSRAALRAPAAHDRRGRQDRRARIAFCPRPTAISSCRRSIAGSSDRRSTLLKPHAALLAARPCVFAINFSGQSLKDDSFRRFSARADRDRAA